MRRIRCLRIRSIGMKKPRTAQPKEPVSDCSWCCFLRKIRFLASSPASTGGGGSQVFCPVVDPYFF